MKNSTCEIIRNNKKAPTASLYNSLVRNKQTINPRKQSRKAVFLIVLSRLAVRANLCFIENVKVSLFHQLLKFPREMLNIAELKN